MTGYGRPATDDRPRITNREMALGVLFAPPLPIRPTVLFRSRLRDRSNENWLR